MKLLKAFNYTRVVVLMALFGLSAYHCQGGNRQEFVKNINKEFALSAGGTVELSNKYGEITIEPWEQNQVRIDVRIVVQADDQSEANQVFERIQVNFTNTSALVRAATEIGEKSSSWWKSWFGNNSDNFKIYYQVRMPKSAKLNTTARYCNVTSGALTGAVALDVKYGNIRLDRVDNNAQITLAYGNGSTGPLRNLALNLRYGNLSVASTEDATLDTQYGEFRLDRGRDLRITSRYDEYRLGNIRNAYIDSDYGEIRMEQAADVVIEADYTQLRIGSLTGKLDADFDYGDVDVESITNNFGSLKLVGDYTDFEIGVPAGVSFSLNAEGRYADISYPESRMNIEYHVEQGSNKTVRGKTKSGAGGTIEARLSYGGLKLRER